jgi:hypothetical protein
MAVLCLKIPEGLVRDDEVAELNAAFKAQGLALVAKPAARPDAIEVHGEMDVITATFQKEPN